jgi:hypothetical protein
MIESKSVKKVAMRLHRYLWQVYRAILNKRDPSVELALLSQGLCYCVRCDEIISVPRDPDSRCLCPRCKQKTT